MLQFVKIRPQPARVGTKKAVPRAVPLAEGSNSSTTSLSTAALSLTKPGKLEVWSDEEDVDKLSDQRQEDRGVRLRQCYR